MPDDTLPLVTFYLTERCNSRCVTCDYWRHGRRDATLASVLNVIPDLGRLRTRVALLSGGEPLLHPQWQAIAGALRSAGIRVWLLTSGLSLAKHADAAAQSFDSITVSLDGTNAETYRLIRGLDAFPKVCEGIRAVVARGAAVSLRVTLQQANYLELPDFVALGRELGVNQVSFLGVDVGNSHAFARSEAPALQLALGDADLPRFAALLDGLERERAGVEDSFIAESPEKMRRIHQYFAALNGLAPFPPIHCNAPEFSAVISADTHVAPCFFIPGSGVTTAGGLVAALADRDMAELRHAIRGGQRPECARCVCSMWRDVSRTDFESLRVPRRRVA
jgi:Fe-coproporphyrin III synthase